MRAVLASSVLQLAVVVSVLFLHHVAAQTQTPSPSRTPSTFPTPNVVIMNPCANTAAVCLGTTYALTPTVPSVVVKSTASGSYASSRTQL